MWAICNNLRFNFRDNNFKIEYLNKWTDIYERVKVELFLCVLDDLLAIIVCLFIFLIYWVLILFIYLH